MDINTSKRVLIATHKAALTHGYRASGYHLESGPGLGKSDGVNQACGELAAMLNEPIGLVTSMLATLSSVDMRGFMIPVRNSGGGMDTIFSTPPWFPTLANTKVFLPDGTSVPAGQWTGDIPKIGVLFLDEFSQADEDVKKPAAELIYHGNVGDCRLPENWRVVSAGNRTSDRSGVMREMMFIVNRRARISVDPSLPAWLDWANGRAPHERPHYLSMSFAQKNPDVVFKDAVPEGSDPFCTPRTLCLMDRDLAALRSDVDIQKNRLPTDAVAREVAASWIGGASAAQYFTHLKYNDELPDFDDIVKDPAKAKLPPNKDAQMVASYMLAHNVTGKTAEQVMGYVNRLNVEMQVLAVRAIMGQQARAADIVSTREVTDWLVTNKKLLVASRS